MHLFAVKTIFSLRIRFSTGVQKQKQQQHKQ